MRRPLAFRAGGKDSSSVRRGGRRGASFRTASLGAAASRKSCRRLGAVLGCTGLFTPGARSPDEPMPSALAAGPSSPAACRRGALLSVRMGPCRPRSALSAPRGVAAWAGRGPTCRASQGGRRCAQPGRTCRPRLRSGGAPGGGRVLSKPGPHGGCGRKRQQRARAPSPPVPLVPRRCRSGHLPAAPGPRPRRQRAWRGGHAGPLCAGISRSSPTWCTRWPERATSWTRPTRTSWPAAATPRRAFCRKRRSFL